ncbi:hypothetical protein [Sphingosinicella sp. CPCC 101087]|uniref:hypothetical protein n=1 Tax=Sphingosinicella sp. CPCC 101087 TaxID=2497754 RepID=UPI0013EB0145|nr:hypothetical protein [Sphingosinicella sp. CPCC 101087]
MTQSLIRKPPSGEVHKGAVSLEPQASRLGVEWGLISDDRELVLYEQAEGLRQDVEPVLDKSVLAAQAVKPLRELVVPLIAVTPINPGSKRAGEDRRLRRAGGGAKALQLIRQIVGQMELMARLEGPHGVNVAQANAKLGCASDA